MGEGTLDTKSNEPPDGPAPPWCDSECVEDGGQVGAPAAGVAAVA